MQSGCKKSFTIDFGSGQFRGAQAMSKAAVAAGIRFEIRLEVDTGAKRTGVPAGMRRNWR